MIVSRGLALTPVTRQSDAHLTYCWISCTAVDIASRF